MAKKTIVVDPGHFASTLGKQSPDGRIKEYAWNFEMAERFVKMLKSAGYDARLTITKAQSEDKKTKDSLTSRANFANKICMPKTQGGEGKSTSDVLFVSIHINAAGNSGWKNARGWSVFVSANKEGKITASKNSQTLANDIFDAVQTQGFMMRKPSPSQKFWPGNFTVLTATKMPAVLIENFFQDNKEDVELLLSESAKSRLLSAWYTGVMKYMGEPNIVPLEDPKNCQCVCHKN